MWPDILNLVFQTAWNFNPFAARDGPALYVVLSSTPDSSGRRGLGGAASNFHVAQRSFDSGRVLKPIPPTASQTKNPNPADYCADQWPHFITENEIPEHIVECINHYTNSTQRGHACSPGPPSWVQWRKTQHCARTAKSSEKDLERQRARLSLEKSRNCKPPCPAKGS